MKKKGSLPEIFLERLTDIVGPSLFENVRRSFVERPTTFRVNVIKARDHKIIKSKLESQGFKIQQVPWCKDAFILKNKSKKELEKAEEYRDGLIYIQSLASMVPPIVLDPKPGETVLDLTAAPGSKTSQMAAMMSARGGSASGGSMRGELVANDVNEVRFARLEANMARLGVSTMPPLPFRSDSSGLPLKGGEDWKFTLRMEDGSKLAQEYNEPYFDKVLLDAVCSSEARFVEGNARTFGYWSEKKIKKLLYIQQKLILSAWSVLKPGGVLVYSTCTLAPEENESRVNVLLERFPDAVVEEVKISGLKKLPAITEWKGKVFDKQVKKTFRVLPTKEMEGFFIAKIRKKN